MSVTDRKIARVDHRKELIDRVADSVLPVLHKAHSAPHLPERFWRRILQPYFWSVAKRHKEYASTRCSARATIYPIDGFDLPSRAESSAAFMRQMLIALGRKGVRRHIESVDQSALCISLGNSATDASDEFNSVPMGIDFAKCFLRFRGAPRADILVSANRESDPIVRNALRYLPKVYVEYFDSFLMLCRQVSSAFDVAKVYVEHFPTFFDLFLASYLGENGAEIVQLQLGAGPGEVVYPGDSLSKIYYDARLTYGWCLNANDIPYYGVRLERFKRQYEAARPLPRSHDALLVYNRLSSKERIAYYEYCNQLIGEHLDRERYPRVLARPRRFSRRVRVLGRARIPGICANSNIEVSSGHGPIANLCRESRIVVHWSHPATNFLECIFVDQPVIAVSSELKKTPLFKPFYDFFMEAGILHAKPENLIQHLNQIEPETWWKQVMADPRYDQFKKKFARSREQYQHDAMKGSHSQW